VRVEFIPEPNCVAGIAKQIRSSFRAYPLFGTARLFLEKPERHRVRITTLDPAVPLFQCSDGPVSFDRESVERAAFHHLKEEYYSEEQVQGEPPKGNYTNVARSRTAGIFLGPTNYHGYQPALRKLYEERFSRRMSFQDFLRDDIQILSNEQAVADWKEQARSSTTYSTKQEAEPVTFKTPAEVEAHFRQKYLPQLVKSGTTLETSGHASRAINERGILNALRETWEKERGFPQSLVNLLRPHLVESGLHFFKHRKRILYVTPIRPQRHAAGELFSEGISSILVTVSEHPKITRPQLATRLLGEGHDAPEALPRKAALASDLHYLIQSGHVIEFHDGTLDLPLAPTAKPEPEGADESKGSDNAASQSAAPASVTHAADADLPDQLNASAESVSGELPSATDTSSEQTNQPAPETSEPVHQQETPPAPDGTPEEPPIVIEVNQTASGEESSATAEQPGISAQSEEVSDALQPVDYPTGAVALENSPEPSDQTAASDIPSQEAADTLGEPDESRR
jgi:hypothetical protein